jgi:hypothetical protein
MSKFLLNLLVQISKAFVYSKIQILFGNNSPQLSAHPAFRPSRGPFLFFLSNRPLPLSPLGLGLLVGPVGPCVGGALPGCRLPHGEAPPVTLPSPSLRARLTGGPHLSSLTSSPPELGRAATTSHRFPRRPAPPRMPPEPLPPRHHFPLLNPPLNLALAFNGVNAINVAVTPPLATPLRCSPQPL